MLYTALCLFVKCDTCNSYGNKIDLIWFEFESQTALYCIQADGEEIYIVKNCCTRMIISVYTI